MDTDRHSGGWLAPYVWPATRLDHLGSFSEEWNFYFNADLEPQTESVPLINCQTYIGNIFILGDKSLGGKILFSYGLICFGSGGETYLINTKKVGTSNGKLDDIF